MSILMWIGLGCLMLLIVAGVVQFYKEFWRDQ